MTGYISARKQPLKPQHCTQISTSELDEIPNDSFHKGAEYTLDLGDNRNYREGRNQELGVYLAVQSTKDTWFLMSDNPYARFIEDGGAPTADATFIEEVA